MEALDTVLLVAGIVFILEGVPYFGFPEAFQRSAERLAQVAPEKLRLCGFALMVLGLVLLLLRRLFFL